TIYHGWLVAAVWLVIRGYALWGLRPNEAVQGYFEVAGDWLGGFIPYADFKIEYPPGALLLFVLPRFFTELPLMYAYGFAFVMLLADLGILLILWRISGLVPEGEVKDITARRYQRTQVCLAYLLLTAVFGRLLYQSYDLMLALVLVASIFLALRNKFVLVDVLLAVAVWLNLTALIWIPFFWLDGSANGNKGSGIRGAGEIIFGPCGVVSS
ncbi:MAG: glycosyltransferase 87 family protein, partial [Desulfobacterales bacterium]